MVFTVATESAKLFKVTGCRKIPDARVIFRFFPGTLLPGMISLCFVTEYLDPMIFGPPGPKYYEIFGPPLKYFIPPRSSCIKGYNCNWRATRLLQQTLITDLAIYKQLHSQFTTLSQNNMSIYWSCQYLSTYTSCQNLSTCLYIDTGMICISCWCLHIYILHSFDSIATVTHG